MTHLLSGKIENQQRAGACLLVLLAMLLPGRAVAESRPWPEGERLALDLFWPSGVSLGEATLEAKSIKDTLYFSAIAEVALPQGRILYKLSSTATPELCSLEFRQSVQRPGKFWEETTKFDAAAGKAVISRDGRSREVAAPSCSRDPLALLYYYRAQAAAGKPSRSETMFLGGASPLRIETQGKDQIRIKQFDRRGEHYKVLYPSAAGEGVIELWLADAPSRSLIAVRLPLPLATFSAELRGE